MQRSGTPRIVFHIGNKKTRFTLSPFDWLMQFLHICAISGKASVQAGFGCIPNLGALRSNSSITNVSPERSNAGWTRGTDHVFFAEAIARRSLVKHFVISTGSVSR